MALDAYSKILGSKNVVPLTSFRNTSLFTNTIFTIIFVKTCSWNQNFFQMIIGQINFWKQMSPNLRFIAANRFLAAVFLATGGTGHPFLAPIRPQLQDI